MDTVTGLAILTAYLFLLGLGGIVADYVLPHIPLLARYFNTLPGWEDGAEYSSKTREGSNPKDSGNFENSATFHLPRLYNQAELQVSRMNQEKDDHHENQKNSFRFSGRPHAGRRHLCPRSGCRKCQGDCP